MTSSVTHVTSQPTTVTSLPLVAMATRQFHSTPRTLEKKPDSLFDRMFASSFKYEIILPDDETKPKVIIVVGIKELDWCELLWAAGVDLFTYFS